MSKLKNIVLATNFMLCANMMCAQSPGPDDPCDPGYQSAADKNRIYQSLKTAKAETNTISRKISSDQVPPNALDLGDFNSKGAQDDFDGGKIVDDCKRQNKPFITYQRGEDHYVMAAQDLEHINDFHAGMVANLDMPNDGHSTSLSTQPALIIQSDPDPEGDCTLETSFHTFENLSRESMDVLAAHEVGHTAKNYQRALEIGSDAMQRELLEHKLLALQNDPAAKKLAQEDEFDADKYAISVCGATAYLHCMYGVAGYTNNIASGGVNVTSDERQTWADGKDSFFRFGDDAYSPDHPSLGRRIQLGEAVQKCGATVASPAADMEWKPQVSAISLGKP